MAADRQWRNYLSHHLMEAQSSFYTSTIPPLPDSELLSRFTVGVSNENFLGGDKVSMGTVDYAVKLSRYKNIFPHTKVLIVIRNQVDLVYSQHVQLVRVGYTKSIDTYLKELMWDSQQSIWGRLCFDKIYDITKNYFDDVLVVPYESILEYKVFIQQLNNFFERSYTPPNKIVNSASDDNSVRVMRMLNIIFRHGYGRSYQTILPSHMIGGGRFEVNKLSIKKPNANVARNVRRWSSRITKGLLTPKHKARDKFKERYKTVFEDHFSDSNHILNENVRLDLGKYDYVGMEKTSPSRGS